MHVTTANQDGSRLWFGHVSMSISHSYLSVRSAQHWSHDSARLCCFILTQIISIQVCVCVISYRHFLLCYHHSGVCPADPNRCQAALGDGFEGILCKTG